jgi:hypothetical protein
MELECLLLLTENSHSLHLSIIRNFKLWLEIVDFVFVSFFFWGGGGGGVGGGVGC